MTINILHETLDVFVNRWSMVWNLILEHIYLSFLSILIAIIISVPLGIFLTRHKNVAGPIIGITSIFQTIPSLALLVFLVPFIGTGKLPAIIALTVYGLLPILRNTYLGIMGVDDSIIEAGKGMGMTNRQILWMVELPLSLRVIMGGVRTASVLVIGVATIAGLIGAGGLGDLIYRGLQTLNTGLILSGAIPAAVLAIIFDYLLKKLEEDVTPKGLQDNKKPSHKTIKVLRWSIVGIIILALVGNFTLKSLGGDRDNTIVISGKNFTEQQIMVYIMGHLIEDKTDLNVEYHSFLGGTSPVFNGVKKGDYDLYCEYTGTGLIEILKHDIVSDPDKVYDIVKKQFKEKYDLDWLEPIGFNNTYTLTVRQEDAEKYGLNTISDLKKVESKFTLGSEPEFLERKDGYPGLKKAYGLNFASTKSMDSGIMYSSEKNKEVDVIDAFGTDGRIPAYHLKVLKDDKHFFPPYYAAPLIRDDTLKAHPELKKVLNMLQGKIDDQTMQSLNKQVDLDKKDYEDVAVNWLKKEGLID
ncbi:osmoprotectant transport system permease protein [Pullulanibacillus pueri]|uniref:Glycine betaine/L-proline ABC transporter permease/substrate-binding protein n=1 Tax=Pullulanibacillus pueri TaxID=1437324 RepID=A0A8J2ZWK8_9BACL|nr:glycine betaine ABC transporter substrate-binding protein [Pullulanibacillus pueri]MBM7681913.1 osmoprotectant transport system permease protein [Pullulanibacillus pueri]GGH83420.1 glycine betaine/L-proline ABC transporter permease/substrate-binding protein [Pullulanibacillus pueri]